MKQDITLKKLFRNNLFFSDFVNAIYFNGNQIVHSENCTDCDLSTINNGLRIMDVVKKVWIEDRFVYFGIENQLVMDDSMPLRMLESIAGFEIRQRIELQKKIRKLRC